MRSALEQIDHLLADWAAKTALIDQNLVDLASDPVFAVLEKAVLEGATAKRVAPALDAMEDLFVRRRLLEDIISEAKAIRSSVTMFRHGHRLADVEKLLREPSIEVPGRAAEVTHRGLLDADQPDHPMVRATPADVLATMKKEFDDVRTVVAEIGTAWDQMTPKVDAAEAELRTLEGSARGAGAGATAQFTQVSDAIVAARRLVAVDPLGAAPAAVGVLAGNVAALRRRLAQH